MNYHLQLFVVAMLYQLALMRLTRLINADTILDGPRAMLAAREKQHVSIADGLQANLDQAQLYEHHRALARRWQTALYFVQCPWCVGLWLALLTAWAPMRLLNFPWWSWPVIALAASHLIGVFAFAADTEEIGYEDETVN